MKMRFGSEFVDVPVEVVTLVLEGKKLQAIKIVRSLIPTLYGLREAKEFVEKVKQVMNNKSTFFIAVENSTDAMMKWMESIEKRLALLEAKHDEKETVETTKEDNSSPS